MKATLTHAYDGQRTPSVYVYVHMCVFVLVCMCMYICVYLYVSVCACVSSYSSSFFTQLQRIFFFLNSVFNYCLFTVHQLLSCCLTFICFLTTSLSLALSLTLLFRTIGQVMSVVGILTNCGIMGYTSTVLQTRLAPIIGMSIAFVRWFLGLGIRSLSSPTVSLSCTSS